MVSPQTLYEFYAVVSRPMEVNGLGLAPDTADQLVTELRAQFDFRPDPPDLVDHWQHLVSQHRISGKPAHDARQAAWLLAHGLQHIYTLNVRDFARFTPAVVCVG
jgi:predicted nucleic acid-binding protein